MINSRSAPPGRRAQVPCYPPLHVGGAHGGSPRDPRERHRAARAVGQSGFAVTAAPTAVSTGGAITASWTAPSGRPATDWIGFYAVGAPDSAYISRGYTGGATSGNLPFVAPGDAGRYEFRYMLNDGFAVGATSNSVVVSLPGFALTAAPAAVVARGRILGGLDGSQWPSGDGLDRAVFGGRSQRGVPFLGVHRRYGFGQPALYPRRVRPDNMSCATSSRTASLSPR